MTKMPKFLSDAAYDDSVGRMLRQLTNRLKAEMKSRLACLNMNINEYYVFVNLFEREGMTQTQLSERMSMPAYGISRLIDGMSSKNLIERRGDPCSRRSVRVFLTDEAKAKIPEVMGSLEDINDWILKPLDNDEKEAFICALRKLA